jgi:chemotaxis methyl-accepting protein methylase
MDDAQITGATSSYARKYALNGLLAIDDTKDADTDENRNQSEKKGSGKRINKQQMQKVTQDMLTHIENKDALGMREVVDELTVEEQEFIWSQFDTKQKSAIKDLIHQAKQIKG